MTATSAERTAVQAVIAHTTRALGEISPNPVVGRVMLDVAGRTVGESHRYSFAGSPRAEAVALTEAASLGTGDVLAHAHGDVPAQGDTLVPGDTLGPRDHRGRPEGPCGQAILDTGVRRVRYAVSDPTEASGDARRPTETGVEIGVAVESGPLAVESEGGNAEWRAYAPRHRPHVTRKSAATRGGRSAAADGASRWITEPAARRDAHRQDTRWQDTRWQDTRWQDTRWQDTRWQDTRWQDTHRLRARDALAYDALARDAFAHDALACEAFAHNALARVHHLDVKVITPTGPDLRITALVRGRASGAEGVADRVLDAAERTASSAGARPVASRREH